MNSKDKKISEIMERWNALLKREYSKEVLEEADKIIAECRKVDLTLARQLSDSFSDNYF